MALNTTIEHTLLKPDCTAADINKLCEEAIEYEFFGVCVPPYYVQLANKKLEETSVKLVTVVGFPLGYSGTRSKVDEAKKAMEDGAQEIDMVVNMAAIKSGDMTYVRNDISSVLTMVHLLNGKLKVIIETALMSDERIVELCELCAELEVDFVKTSTGFNGAGATVAHVELMRSALPKKIGIKASGGIKEPSFAKELVAAGANRIGTSSGPNLLL